MQTKRLRLSLSLLLLATIQIAGCDRQSGTQSPTTQKAASPAMPKSAITLATFKKALGNTPYLVAKNQKWFEENEELRDVRFEYRIIEDRAMIATEFENGTLQVLFSAEIPAIFTRAQGSRIKIVASSTSAAQEILVPRDSPANRIEDLAGHELAVQSGTSSHYCVLKILSLHKLTERDAPLKLMDADLAKKAFEARDLAAWAVWAPYVEQQEVSGLGRVLPGADARIYSVMTFSDDFMTKQPQQARAVYAIVQRAKQWIVNHPDEAMQIAAKELGYDLAVMKTAWPKFDWRATLNEAAIEDIQQKATFLAEQDKTRKSVELKVRSDLIDLRFRD